MQRRLLKDLNVSELMTMRESGMTNHEIADVLGTSYKAVLAAIGRQPKELRKKPEFHTEILPPPTYAQEQKQEEPNACLVVANRLVELEGTFGSYNIPIRKGIVNITSKECGDLQVPFDKLGDFINELQAIQRKMSSLTMSAEMW